MNQYVTGAVIRTLREQNNMTQAELAEIIQVSDKAVSKWETGHGYPDITLLEPLAAALGISVLELLSGENIQNTNRCANMLRSLWYVCPVCQNVIHSTGQAMVSCCGITLPPMEAEPMDDEHRIRTEIVEDEYYVTMDHPMTKEHYISFVAFASAGEIKIFKTYPEWELQVRFPKRGHGLLLWYCTRHGLFYRAV